MMDQIKQSVFTKVDRANNLYTINAEVREGEDSGKKKLILRGYPILFNVRTKVWDWYYGEIEEVVDPHALDNTDLSGVLLVGGHSTDPGHTLGLNNINMRLAIDEIGLFFECELPNTQYARDIYNLVEAQIIDGMSHGFVSNDRVNPSTLVRTITQYDILYEITITGFPAYKEASVVAMRNKQYYDDKARKEAEELKQAQEAEEKRQQELLKQKAIQEAEEKRQQELALQKAKEREEKLNKLEAM